ncbi:MAG: branched-chain amino acid ABC transporter permease [Nitrospinaceae bacterium]|nr:branched-chain amino acid ABC transporter permease [Nitrospinaceae bacterium]MBT3822637.1 branched-chain amino acid ABC transporter permease [Nitrospinaceae bacterium]MBT4432514.1 branched-chain amino acid ABC transporter permease [Nitrospinaceae bacterium]MBT5366981.1 branched-chain amino acid ABC transporter permease [Nitrospinaceae bacterium]MBT5948054.1 branched-chain amino acid ABC transporter permease [Nitrospinaceae bacterium]
MSNKDHWRNLGILGGSVVLLLFVPPIFSIYIRSFFMFMMMYVVLSLSWNIISGYTGYISFGHVVFYGVGTYTTAILVVDYGWHWIGGLIAAGVVGVVYAILIGFPVLRLKGPYFAIAMLGAAEGTRVIAINWVSLTHGADGIAYKNIENSWETYHAMLVLMIVTIIVSYWVGHSRFGIRLNAIREDEIAAESLGVNTTFYKLAALALSAFFAAIAGGIQGYKTLYIEPESEFFILVTIYMKLFAMFGGRGTVVGPILGVAVLYSVQEYTWIRFPTAHLITFGIFIILVARFMPRGLMGFAIDHGWARKGMVH